MSVELWSSIYDGWWNIRDAPVIRRINSRRALSTSAASAIAIKAHRWKEIRSKRYAPTLRSNFTPDSERTYSTVPIFTDLKLFILSLSLAIRRRRTAEDFQFRFSPVN